MRQISGHTIKRRASRDIFYELQKDKLELEVKAMGARVPKSVVDEYEKKIEYYSKNVKRYDEEKAQIQKEARKFEGIRDDAQIHAQVFGIAVIFLQIAILLSSIAALLKRKSVWVLGLITGVFGMAYFLNGFWLFIK